MLDEFEIAVWIKLVDRFTLQEDSYSIYDEQVLIDGALRMIFNIAVVVKFLVNDLDVKEPIMTYLLTCYD